MMSNRPKLLLATATGARRQDLSGRPDRLPSGIQDLLNADDVTFSTYARAANGQIIRLNEEDAPCALGPKGVGWTIEALGDLNGDGTLDAVAHDSCRECTSNHVFLRGVAAER